MYTNLILRLPGRIQLTKRTTPISRQERRRLVHLSLLESPAVPNKDTKLSYKYGIVSKTIPIGPKMNTSNIHAWAEDMRIDNHALSYKLV